MKQSTATQAPHLPFDQDAGLHQKPWLASERGGARTLLVLLLACVALVLAVLQSQGYFRATGEAHVILISIDTLRADRILDPLNKLETPQIDALAADGIQFDACYSHAPMTLPAHTAMFSSRPPNESGVMVNGAQVSPDLPLLAEHLSKHGYETSGMISMPVLRPHNQEALARGFKHFNLSDRPMVTAEVMAETFKEMLSGLDPEIPQFIFLHSCDPHAPYNTHGYLNRTASVSVDGEVLEEVPTSQMSYWEKEIALSPGEHIIEITSADEFMLRRFLCEYNGAPADRPDQVWVRSFKATFEQGKILDETRRIRMRVTNTLAETKMCSLVAWVHDIPDASMGASSRYDAEVEYSDALIGEVISALREKDMYDSSLILLTSDHGEELSKFGGGHGHSLRDDLLHVPLIIKPPLGFGAASRAFKTQSRRLVRHVDLAPTILELVERPPLSGQRGVSLLSDNSDRVLVAETYRPEAKTNQIALRSLQYKLVYFIESDHFELYDLIEDAAEEANLFDSLGAAFGPWQKQLRLIGLVTGAGDAIDFNGLDEESREQLQALGYFGDE